MRTFARRTAIAMAITLLGAGAAFAAEKCCCCKDGEKMACCEKMHGETAPKPAESSPPQPEHQH